MRLLGPRLRLGGVEHHGDVIGRLGAAQAGLRVLRTVPAWQSRAGFIWVRSP
jgi:hypothetical protein